MVSDVETMILKAIAGDIDFQWRRLHGLENYTLLMEYQKKGDYRVINMLSLGSNYYTIFLNYHHKDPVLRKLFRDKRFRIALSVAINRNEVSTLITKGTAAPSQVAPGPETSALYEERIAKLYTGYDPKRANQLLDEIGLKWDKSHEYRLRSDGKRLRVVIIAELHPLGNVEAMELVKGYWKNVGIQVVVKPITYPLWNTRTMACEHDIVAYAVTVGYSRLLPITGQVFPLDQYFYTAPMWGLWFSTNGKSGEEPPAELKQMMKHRHEAIITTSSEKRNELIKEAFRISVENLLQIGMLRPLGIERFCIAKNNFRNIPEPSLDPGDLTIQHLATCFIKK